MKKSIFFLIILSLLTSCASTRKIADNSQKDISLTTQRDGSSFEKAIIIDKDTEKQGVSAEYEWIRQNYPGYKHKSQMLTHKNNIPFDVIDIITSDGQTRSLYFNISKFFGKF